MLHPPYAPSHCLWTGQAHSHLRLNTNVSDYRRTALSRETKHHSHEPSPSPSLTLRSPSASSSRAHSTAARSRPSAQQPRACSPTWTSSQSDPHNTCNCSRSTGARLEARGRSGPSLPACRKRVGILVGRWGGEPRSSRKPSGWRCRSGTMSGG